MQRCNKNINKNPNIEFINFNININIKILLPKYKTLQQMVDSKKYISLNNIILLDDDQKNKIRRNKSLSDLNIND